MCKPSFICYRLLEIACFPKRLKKWWWPESTQGSARFWLTCYLVRACVFWGEFGSLNVGSCCFPGQDIMYQTIVQLPWCLTSFSGGPAEEDTMPSLFSPLMIKQIRIFLFAAFKNERKGLWMVVKLRLFPHGVLLKHVYNFQCFELCKSLMCSVLHYDVKLNDLQDGREFLPTGLGNAICNSACFSKYPADVTT